MVAHSMAVPRGLAIILAGTAVAAAFLGARALAEEEETPPAALPSLSRVESGDAPRVAVLPAPSRPPALRPKPRKDPPTVTPIDGGAGPTDLGTNDINTDPDPVDTTSNGQDQVIRGGGD